VPVATVLRRTVHAWVCLVVAAVCFIATSFSFPHDALADTKQECSDSYQKTQVLRAADKLEEAIGQADICVRTCSKSFLDECASWKTSLESRIASIIVEAVDATGEPVTDGSVSLDGVPWLDQLGGPARAVSKGPHTLEVTVKGAPSQKKSIVIREGEKSRKITVSIPSSPAPDNSGEVHRIGPWVVGGVGVAALIAGAVTGGLVLDAYSVTQEQCNDGTGTCTTQEGIDASERGQLLGPVTTGLLVGGSVLVAGGIIWLVVAPTEAKPSTTSLTVAPTVSHEHVGLVVGGSW
jgi:hypothetical protein